MVLKSTLQYQTLTLPLTISSDFARFLEKKVQKNTFEVGFETPGDWLDAFAMLTECTDAKFCNTTAQVPKAIGSSKPHF